MKPFVKWAGGKTRLISRLESNLPLGFNRFRNITYVEPFVGGGAMLFHMLEKYPNIARVIINDINPDLISAYNAVKHSPEALIKSIAKFQRQYLKRESSIWREKQYYVLRDIFNSNIDGLDRAALFLFLNRTCYNGLYRVNGNGKFNVPHGKYPSPAFCSEEVIYEASKALQRVEIMTGDFEKVIDIIGNFRHLFFYLDPPYRPISKEVGIFTQYDSSGFGDEEQERLKEMCDEVNRRGGYFMVSNSDSQTENGAYFDQLYEDYNVKRFGVTRLINTYNARNMNPTEVLITNY